MNLAQAREFFGSQSFTGVASQHGRILGLYILHPNNVGRCGHIANASYAVKSGLRGRHIGEQLVRDCLGKAKELGYRILQFNAVVETNYLILLPAVKGRKNLHPKQLTKSINIQYNL